VWAACSRALAGLCVDSWCLVHWCLSINNKFGGAATASCRLHQRCSHLALWGSFPATTTVLRAGSSETGRLRCYVAGGEQVRARFKVQQPLQTAAAHCAPQVVEACLCRM
jgi:hypothetical protein